MGEKPYYDLKLYKALYEIKTIQNFSLPERSE